MHRLMDTLSSSLDWGLNAVMQGMILGYCVPATAMERKAVENSVITVRLVMAQEECNVHLVPISPWTEVSKTPKTSTRNSIQEFVEIMQTYACQLVLC